MRSWLQGCLLFLSAGLLEQSQTNWAAYSFTSECVWCATHSTSSFHSEAGANIKHIFSGQYTWQNPCVFSTKRWVGMQRAWTDQVRNSLYLLSTEVLRSIRLACLFGAMFKRILVKVRLFPGKAIARTITLTLGTLTRHLIIMEELIFT